jgi:hypothetical protein
MTDARIYFPPLKNRLMREAPYYNTSLFLKLFIGGSFEVFVCLMMNS